MSGSDHTDALRSSPKRLVAPVFLLGSERSGTNLVRSILGAHPQIVAPTPPHLLMTFLPTLHRYGPLSDDANFGRLAEDVATAVEHQLGEWASHIDAREILDDVDERSFGAILDYVYWREMTEGGGSRMVFKESEAAFSADYLLRVFPDAQFLYLVRDGRDVVVSYRKSLTHFGTAQEAAVQWRDEQAACLKLVCDSAFSDRVFALHYEDVLTFPRETIERVVDFLGVSYEDRMLQFHEADASKRASSSVADWQNLSKPLMSANFGKYDELPSGMLAKVERTMCRELHLAGYPVDPAIIQQRSSGLSDAFEKGWMFARNVIQTRRMLSPDELRMRRGRMEVNAGMQRRLDEALRPLLVCRALSVTEIE